MHAKIMISLCKSSAVCILAGFLVACAPENTNSAVSSGVAIRSETQTSSGGTVNSDSLSGSSDGMASDAADLDAEIRKYREEYPNEVTILCEFTNIPDNMNVYDHDNICLVIDEYNRVVAAMSMLEDEIQPIILPTGTYSIEGPLANGVTFDIDVEKSPVVTFTLDGVKQSVVISPYS